MVASEGICDDRPAGYTGTNLRESAVMKAIFERVSAKMKTGPRGAGHTTRGPDPTDRLKRSEGFMEPTHPSPVSLSESELSALPGPEFGDGRLPERFWSKIHIDSKTRCWVWTGYVTSAGYSRFRGRAGHRVAYQVLVGGLAPFTPSGPQLDHLCRVRACVNPGHLELVTPRINFARAEGARAASARSRLTTGRCARGHLDWEPQPTSSGLRCKACQNRRYELIRDASRSLGLSTRQYIGRYGRANAVAEAVIAAARTEAGR